MFKDKFKEGASTLGGGLKGMLGKLLIGGEGKDDKPFVAFMNSPYWEKMKTLLQDTIANFSWSLQQCTETNLGCRTIKH